MKKPITISNADTEQRRRNAHNNTDDLKEGDEVIFNCMYCGDKVYRTMVDPDMIDNESTRYSIRRIFSMCDDCIRKWEKKAEKFREV